MELEIVEADVLCIGGGPAGLMAAIHASELGARVVVAEKGNTLRSGAGATGNDHFNCYIPEIHGKIEPVVAARMKMGGIRSRNTVRARLERSFEVVKLWDSWGIPMKYKGKYEFAGHDYPGSDEPAISLKFEGQNQKRILTQQAVKRGVKIMNRVMIFDLVCDDSIIGAVGVHTREQKLICFKAKSAILGTGILTRMYPSPTPSLMFNIGRSPATTGDGRAMAYRAGAELFGLELPRRWAGPKYFIKQGKATWVGVLRDSHGKPVGPFVTKPDRRYGDATSDVWPALFEEYHRTGKGPVYMDCGGISDEDFEYMKHWFIHEGLTSILNIFEKEGADPRKHPVEFTTYEILPLGGIVHNEQAETSIPGLYAAGDEMVGGGLPGAAVFGWIAGESAAHYVQHRSFGNIQIIESKVAEIETPIHGIVNRKTGARWQEINTALQQIMQDYAGVVRSETLLNAGLGYLKTLRAKAYDQAIAKNQHELTRCLEVFNLLDLGELIFIMALERKESRGFHVRPDYPFSNPALNKMLVIKKAHGKPVTEWRAVNK